MVFGRKRIKRQSGQSDGETDGQVSWSRKNFATLDSLLDRSNFDSYDHDEIANEIEENGIYRWYGGEIIEHYSGRSSDAEAALVRVSQHCIRSQNPMPPLDYEDWNVEHDVIGLYGWPKSELPKFQKTYLAYHWIEAFWQLKENGSFGNEEICSISRLLLTRKANPAGIKCAIEQDGFFRVDETNRPEYKAFDIFRCHEVLEDLDRYAKTLKSGNFYTADTILLSTPSLLSHGWPYDAIPDFNGAIEIHKKKMWEAARGNKSSTEKTSSAVDAPNPDQSASVSTDGDKSQIGIQSHEQDHTGKTKSSREHVMCGLILLLEGKLGKVEIPMPEAKIRKFFEETYPDVTGCSENHLRKAFKEALAHSYTGFGIPHESIDIGGSKKGSTKTKT